MDYRDLCLSFKAFGLSWLLREKVSCFLELLSAPLLKGYFVDIKL